MYYKSSIAEFHNSLSIKNMIL